MRLSQALGYFVREALTSLRRGWRVSALAVLTIAVSLYVAGLFLIVSHNLGQAAQQWRSEARWVAYLQPGSSTAAAEALAVWAAAQPGVEGTTVVPVEAAEERFRRAFPSLAGAIGAEGVATLPPSVEIATSDEGQAEVVHQLLSQLRERPEVEWLDDDRDWLGRLDTMVVVTRTVGLLIGGLLLAAAVFTIYSVIRLTAYLYREEIDVMRLVGATELMIRGPFYLEGLIQGSVGAVAALAGLSLTHALVGYSETAQSVAGRLLMGEFVSVQAMLSLLVIGSLSGLLGAALSLGREISRTDDAPADTAA